MQGPHNDLSTPGGSRCISVCLSFSLVSPVHVLGDKKGKRHEDCQYNTLLLTVDIFKLQVSYLEG